MTTTRIYTAQELADMPAGEARNALRSQEVAYMNQHHGKQVLQDAQEAVDSSIARVNCTDLEDRIFLWEGSPKCTICDGSGMLSGGGREYDCPECEEAERFDFKTDYDGNLIEEDDD